MHSVFYNLLTLCASVPAVIPVILFRKQTDILWLSVAIGVLATTPSVLLAYRFLDGRAISSVGLRLNRWAFYDLMTGIGITLCMMGLIFGIEFAMGWLTIEGVAWQADSGLNVGLELLGAFVLFILVGWNEELLFRGYRLKNLSEGLTPFWGVVISSVWFGLIHLGNPYSSASAAIGILLAGAFLAYPVMRTGQLWLSIGLHIGWNFFEGPVFGFPVSGLTQYNLIRITVEGPTLFTGGLFGPEAGLVLLPALLIGTGLIFFYTQVRRAWETENTAPAEIPTRLKVESPDE